MNICISGLNYHNTALTTTQNRGGSFYKKVCEAILSSIFLNKMDFSRRTISMSKIVPGRF